MAMKQRLAIKIIITMMILLQLMLEVALLTVSMSPGVELVPLSHTCVPPPHSVATKCI